MAAKRNWMVYTHTVLEKRVLIQIKCREFLPRIKGWREEAGRAILPPRVVINAR